jgi:hypothetical protein
LIQNNGDISIYADQRAAIDSIDRLGLVIDVLSTLLNLYRSPDIEILSLVIFLERR